MSVFLKIAVVLAVLLVVCLYVVRPVVFVLHNRKKRQTLEELLDEDIAEPQTVGACVLTKKTEEYYENSFARYKVPEYKMAFLVRFLTDDGEEKVYEVSQGTFEAVREGQHGTLVTIDGNFFDFGNGEDIE